MNKSYIPLFLIGTFAVFLIGGCAPLDYVPLEEQNNYDPIPAQVVMFGMDRQGYLPREITVFLGMPVTLKNDGTLSGCGKYAVQPELGIRANFAQQSEFTFTPSKKGDFILACSMGMYKTVLHVV